MTTPSTPPINQDFANILTHVIVPFANCAQYLILLTGFTLVWMSMHRVKHHTQGQQGMMQHQKPMPTFMMFIAGTMLISYAHFMQVIAKSFFGTYYPGINGVTKSSFNYQNEITMYAAGIKATGTDALTQVKYFAYGILACVGLISFFAGIHKLVKVGEGQGGGDQSALNKALMHMLAGFIGMNAQIVIGIASNTAKLFN